MFVTNGGLGPNYIATKHVKLGVRNGLIQSPPRAPAMLTRLKVHSHFDESPSRLALDLIYHTEKYGIDQARQLAISYYNLVMTGKFSEHDQQEYCRWAREMVGLSPDDFVSQNSREGR